MGVYLLVLCFVFAYLSSVVELLDNGLARRPPMGWMSWGYYMCGVDCRKNPLKCLDEKLILSVADTFYKEGYLEAGFEYIIIDDCWSEKKRDEYGRLVPDSERFPRGMKYIADYIHKLGLKFGMYTNIAKTTCMGYPGSRDYFKRDAKMFAEWDVDYLKVDGCFVEEDYLNTAYIKLGAHLNTTGRPMVYSCSWPYYIEFIHHKQPDYESVSKYCNVWRSYHDVVTSWRAIKTIITHYQNEYEHLYKFHGPGHWNDPDMLQKQVTLWVKPHLPRKGDKYHSVSFALVNLSEEEVTVSFTPGQYGLNSTDRYTVMDIFSQFFIKNITLSETLEVDVPAEDAIIYTTFPL
ncbi:alpha-N-acetylgalactosaminidase-like isoform X2 [Maniola jurtina]|uniref:alpha-N-acetylgalactosaminidase-like isoform X2 n=1 Tax=Maniola jurtina TaxID=191418 RepID=UPI001E68BF75|nr:alpha-N-acetylgalactosaminidase-like isoform X2 [Maniola jurtina]